MRCGTLSEDGYVLGFLGGAKALGLMKGGSKKIWMRHLGGAKKLDFEIFGFLWENKGTCLKSFA